MNTTQRKNYRSDRDKAFAEGPRSLRKRLKRLPEKDAKLDAELERKKSAPTVRANAQPTYVANRVIDGEPHQGVFRTGDRVNPPKGKTHLLRKVTRNQIGGIKAVEIHRPEKGQGFKKTRLEDLPKLTKRQFADLRTKMITRISGLTGGKLTIEVTALEENCHPNHIREIFVELNKLGVLSQKQREFGHDTNRNNMFPGPSSGWAANSYHVISPENRKPRK